MKSSYIIGAVAVLLAGVAGAWGVSEYRSLNTQLKEVQKAAQVPSNSATITPSPTQTGTSASTVPSPTPSTPTTTIANGNFDALPLCDQLDGIANSKKSVSQFIVNSGRYEEFAAQVNTKCTWHAEQLKQADLILHPPIANNPPVASPDDPQPKRTPWNNCNGIQEPGESPSIECEARKAESDRLGKAVPGDNRPAHLSGKGFLSDDHYYSGDSVAPENKSSYPDENETENRPSRAREGQSDSSRNRLREEQRDNSNHESRSRRSNHSGRYNER
jgi:hypothetical protein